MRAGLIEKTKKYVIINKLQKYVYEREVFEMRSKGISLENIAEYINMSVDGINKISRKGNNKINRGL